MDATEVADRIAVQQLLTTYARAVDTRDWELFASVFTADAQLDYTSAPFGRAGSLGEITEWLAQNLAVVPMTMHYVTNVDAEFDGDTARVQAMFYNPMQFPGVAELSVCGGYYHHELVRTAGGWRSRALREDGRWFVNSPADWS